MAVLLRPLLAALFLAAALAAAPAAARSGNPQPAGASAELSPRHRDWLEEVAPLLSPKEREAFLALRRDYQRDAFVRRFWEVRDPFPRTPRNELAEKWQERVKLVRERYGGLAEDRARMLLLNGEPDNVFRASCSDFLLPLEFWSYDNTDWIRDDFTLVFVQAQGASRGRYRLWYPSEGISSLLSMGMRMQVGDMVGLSAIVEVCTQGDEIAGRLANSLDWALIEKKVPPRPSEEWLASFTSYSTDLPPDATLLPARIDLTFPNRYGSRTVLQAVVSVPRESAGVETLGTTATHSFVVDGEVLREDELFEHFRYRFTMPAGQGKPGHAANPGNAADNALPMVFQRYLRPGRYTLVVKVEDTAGRRFFREQREIEVPSVPAAAAVITAGAATPEPGAAQAPVAAALAEANAAIGSDEQTVRILPPREGLLTGKTRLEAVTTGEGIARVSFELDGRPVLTKSRPPYSVELNLGDQPRFHRLTARALAADGRRLAEDEVLLNAGPHRFSVRLVEPQDGKFYRESVRAHAQVDVPEGDTLAKVEFYLNDDLVATLFQPPFVQPILLGGTQDITYVRAVAHLSDGNSVEDLAVINMPDFGERLDVRLVELYTTVVDRRGRPVEGMDRGDFQVFEDGVAQAVERFELVRDRPFYAGVVIDTSLSMREELDEAIKGALRFFEKVITPKDRAAVFTFNDRPNLAVRFTNQQDVLAGGLAGLEVEGETALYDSLIYALYYFGGLQGKRAIVLLSDGEDTRSRYAFNDVLEYARRSGVAIYSIGMNLPTNVTDLRMKLERLSDETGGRAFFIENARALERIYAKVEEEVRSQYLLAYQSTNSSRDDKFRTVEVKLSRPGFEAKTIRGYYP